MSRLPALSLVCLAACAADESFTSPSAITAAAPDPRVSLGFTREKVAGDVYHYELTLPVSGGQPNAALRLHRVVRELAPFVPRPTASATMLLHGDFSTFLSNFAPTLGHPASPAPGLAPYLAQQNIDVWGLDRRWALPAAGDDVSDFADVGVVTELADLRAGLAFARATRLLGGHGSGRIALVGFSHGAQLAYLYASQEASRPLAQRHVDALVPLDFYGAYGPEQVDARAASCASAASQYAALADGIVDAPNDFFIDLARLARTAPDEPSPLFGPDYTNRSAFLATVGQTYFFVPFAPAYHLLAPVLDEAGNPIALADTSDAAALAWLEGATAHQAVREQADLDALLCNEAPLPVDAPLARIRVPLFYIGAAGGVGELGVFTTTQVASTDVTTLVVQRDSDPAADFGHGDLLLADDAPALVFQPLAAWLAAH